MRKIFLFIIVCISITSFMGLQMPVNAQQITPTAVRVVIATSTPQSTLAFVETPTISWTPTPEGSAQLEAKAEAGEVNVRAEPDTAAQRLGAIQTGERYVVRSRYFSWFQFDYPASPTGTAWVYGELVTISGDESLIPERDPFAVPTSALEAAQEATLAVALETPGGDATATADARVLVIPTSTPGVGESSLLLAGSLPTYTPPAEFNSRIAATESSADSQGALLTAITSVSTQGVPPIVPIMGLVIIGIVGMTIGILRR